jgi:hypothetical protein
VDEGQTKPRLSYNGTSSNATVDVVPLTSGSGNVKGFQCSQDSGVYVTRLHFYVDGGAAQDIDPGLALFHTSPDGTVYYTDMVPISRRARGLVASTVVSWGLD